MRRIRAKTISVILRSSVISGNLMFMLAFYCAEWATSASMQSRDKDNIISRLHFIFLLAFQLPIRVVDENQNSRPPA